MDALSEAAGSPDQRELGWQAHLAGRHQAVLLVVVRLGPRELRELGEQRGGIGGQRAVGHVVARTTARTIADRRRAALVDRAASVRPGERDRLALESTERRIGGGVAGGEAWQLLERRGRCITRGWIFRG